MGGKIRKHLDYYPRDPYGYNRGPRDYVVRYICDRQETLRVFIPRERLDDAQANGLVLYVRPRGGLEEVLTLPPNYISGFKLAAWSPEGARLTIPAQAVLPTHVQPDHANPNPADNKKPIIYGEN